MHKRKMIWIGDAAVATGFARATHYILDVLKETWEVCVLGINYFGDPHKYPYPIYPCYTVRGGDLFGLNRMVPLIERYRPDVLVIQNDPWNVPAYVTKAGNVPVIASMPVDGKNCKGRALNGLSLAIFWTEFGLYEAQRGGYVGPAAVVPLGVDLAIYMPKDRIEARAKAGLPKDLDEAFIVGNVNRNQPRKRLDLTIQYFAEWVKEYGIRDAFLFLHVAPTGDAGFDVQQLMDYYGLSNRLIISEPPDIGYGIDESMLVDTYATFDLQITTTQGEGWGLTTMEGMACGIPQIVPDWAALGEWCEDAVIKVPCSTQAMTPNHINVVGGVPDRTAMVDAMNSTYRDMNVRNELRDKGLELVKRPEYRWSEVGKKFAQVIEDELYISLKGEVVRGSFG